MKTRSEILEEERKLHDQKIIKDYFKRDNGGFLYTVRELAVKHKISVPQIYKVLERNGIKARQ